MWQNYFTFILTYINDINTFYVYMNKFQFIKYKQTINRYVFTKYQRPQGKNAWQLKQKIKKNTEWWQYMLNKTKIMFLTVQKEHSTQVQYRFSHCCSIGPRLRHHYPLTCMKVQRIEYTQEPELFHDNFPFYTHLSTLHVFRHNPTHNKVCFFAPFFFYFPCRKINALDVATSFYWTR